MRATLAFALLMLCAAAEGQAPMVVEPDGVFALGDARAERAAFEAAIDDVCAAMDPLTRLIARPMLIERNAAYREVELRVTDTTLRFRLGDWSGPVVRLGGAVVVGRTERGEPVRVSARLMGADLVLRRETAQGVRTDTFRLNAAGDTLTVASSVESPRLPRVLRFAFTYHRSR